MLGQQEMLVKLQEGQRKMPKVNPLVPISAERLNPFQEVM